MYIIVTYLDSLGNSIVKYMYQLLDIYEMDRVIACMAGRFINVSKEQ